MIVKRLIEEADDEGVIEGSILGIQEGQESMAANQTDFRTY